MTHQSSCIEIVVEMLEPYKSTFNDSKGQNYTF